MEMMELPEKERRLLLKALGYEPDRKTLRCGVCNSITYWKECGIMPPLIKGNRATILCKSILCYAEYLERIGE